MTISIVAPWHAASFEGFVRTGLPELLASRLPLTSYRVESTEQATYTVRLSLSSGAGVVEATYDAIPFPDDLGVFLVGTQRRVVLPVAPQADLEEAEIRCVGEQLRDYVDARLGHAPDNLLWDEPLLRAWLPLDEWINAFLVEHPTAETLVETNWLSIRAQARQLVVAHSEPPVTPAHVGRVCPVESVEGDGGERRLVIATGATIQDGRLVIVDPQPEATLGVTAAMIPLLEHNPPARLQIGTDLMRAWMPVPDPEPALVQTGAEPDEPAFWCGRNLLTAFVGWGPDTFEDAILISQSCARRFALPHPIEPGDLLSNRHGARGVVSRIVPDDEMPWLADGTPVELVYHVTGLISRLNFGQVREALLGRIARLEGQPVIVPPFHAPSPIELRERAVRAGLAADGMETLLAGRAGQPLRRPSLAGWVYWGRAHQTAEAAFQVSVAEGGQRQGEGAYLELRDAGAVENIREHFNTRATERPDGDTLAERVAASPVPQSEAPTPMLAELQRRLAVAGIRAELTEGLAPRLRFRLEPPRGDTLRLATPLLHPWLRGWSATGWYPEYQITEIGAFPEAPAYLGVVEANQRVERMLVAGAPESLRTQAVAGLDRAVSDFFGTLLTPEHVRFGARVLFSGRARIAPGGNLGLDQVGVPDAMAWALFGPLLLREHPDAAALDARTPEAARALDDLMARSWVLVYHGAGIDLLYAGVDAPFLAFHAVRVSDRVIRLHPLVCNLMDADFQGDEVELFLPLTEGAQAEAGARLSLAATVERHPGPGRRVTPSQLAVWGLADLSLSPEGRRDIDVAAGVAVEARDGYVDKQGLARAIQQVYDRDGYAAAGATAERLMRLGFEANRASGFSMSPFFGEGFAAPQAPESDDPATWQAYTGELIERLRDYTDYLDNDVGGQLLSVKSGARGNGQLLIMLICAVGLLPRTGGDGLALIRHGYVAGLTPQELSAVAAAYRIAEAHSRQDQQQANGVSFSAGSEGSKVLARARRSPAPGIVFARAAAMADEDPLRSTESRLFVGLAATGQE